MGNLKLDNERCNVLRCHDHGTLMAWLLEHPTGVRRVMSLTPVRDSDFFSWPHAHDTMYIASFSIK